MPSRRSRKERLDHSAQKLWKVSLDLFQAMGYRSALVSGIDDFSGDPPVFEVILEHRDPKHRIRPDVEAIASFLDKQFRIIPFEVRIDSKARRLLLRKALVRHVRDIPPMRSILV